MAGFRHTLRGFLHFSEKAAGQAGLAPQQHQALLAIRAAVPAGLMVGELADQLFLRPHSASELVNRLVQAGLIEKVVAGDDRRKVSLALTTKAELILQELSAIHRAELRRLRPLLVALLDRL